MQARPPAWLIFPGAVFALLLAALHLRPDVSAPAAPPPLPAAQRAALAQTTPFDVLQVRRVRRAFGGRSGAAFSIGDAGLWLALGDGFGSCGHPALTVGAGQGVAARPSPGAGPVLAVLSTPGGAPALPIAAATPQPGALAYVAGFPQGRPGEAALQLLGPQTLYRPGRGEHSLTVLVWAVIGRTDGLRGDVQGLAGSPVLDSGGRVVGVVLGEAPRRGRFYAATPAAILQTLAAAGVRPSASAAGQAIGPDSYGLVADDLRRNWRVIPAVCATG